MARRAHVDALALLLSLYVLVTAVVAAGDDYILQRLERCERNAALCEADDVACHEIAITCFLRHDHPAARSLASAQALICRAADPTDMDLASQCGPISAEQLKLAPPSTLLRLADALRGEGSRRRVLAIEPGEMEMYDEPRTRTSCATEFVSVLEEGRDLDLNRDDPIEPSGSLYWSQFADAVDQDFVAANVEDFCRQLTGDPDACQDNFACCERVGREKCRPVTSSSRPPHRSCTAAHSVGFLGVPPYATGDGLGISGAAWDLFTAAAGASNVGVRSDSIDGFYSTMDTVAAQNAWGNRPLAWMGGWAGVDEDRSYLAGSPAHCRLSFETPEWAESMTVHVNRGIVGSGDSIHIFLVHDNTGTKQLLWSTATDAADWTVTDLPESSDGDWYASQGLDGLIGDIDLEVDVGHNEHIEIDTRTNGDAADFWTHRDFHGDRAGPNGHIPEYGNRADHAEAQVFTTFRGERDPYAPGSREAQCEGHIPRMFYWEGTDQYISSECRPQLGHNCNEPDLMLRNERYWVIGGDSANTDKKLCEDDAPPSCWDGVQNRDEGGIDCGGTYCAACRQALPAACGTHGALLPGSGSIVDSNAECRDFAISVEMPPTPDVGYALDLRASPPGAATNWHVYLETGTLSLGYVPYDDDQSFEQSEGSDFNNDPPINDPPANDPGMNDPGMNEPWDDSWMDDSWMDDSWMDDSWMNDPSWNDPEMSESWVDDPGVNNDPPMNDPPANDPPINDPPTNDQPGQDDDEFHPCGENLYGEGGANTFNTVMSLWGDLDPRHNQNAQLLFWDDDEGCDRASKIDVVVPPGLYHVVVEGHSTGDVGSFALFWEIDGTEIPLTTSESLDGSFVGFPHRRLEEVDEVQLTSEQRSQGGVRRPNTEA